MRTNLSAKFTAVRDTRIVADPWGVGVQFEIERSDSPAFLAWVEERTRGNPVFAKLNQVSARSALLAIADRARRQAKGDVELEQLLDPASKELEGVTFTQEELAGFTPISLEESVARRLKNFTGLTDAATSAAVPCTEETKHELLTSQEWLAPGMPYAGDEGGTLGVALQLFLDEQSRLHAEFRGELGAAVGKGCGSTSDGSTSTSSDPTG